MHRLEMRLPRAQIDACQKAKIGCSGKGRVRLGLKLGAGLMQVDFLLTKRQRIARCAIGCVECLSTHAQALAVELKAAIDVLYGQNKVVQSGNVRWRLCHGRYLT